MATEIIIGTARLLKAFQEMGLRAQWLARENTERATERVFTRVRENASLADHSLKDLADLDHPYSKRRPRKIHDPAWKVHRQSGDLYDAIASAVIAHPMLYRGLVGIDENSAPHARVVIFGTPKMVARDFLNETLRANRKHIRKMLLKDFPVRDLEG